VFNISLKTGGFSLLYHCWPESCCKNCAGGCLCPC